MATMTAHWFPTAAYLYVLHLDAAGLAWEYLRRNPDYRNHWRHCRQQQDAGRRWGLRVLEDPTLDARAACPAWFPEPDAFMQLYPDFDPPPNSPSFELWRLAGNKHLVHDGKRLMLIARQPMWSACFTLAPGLEDGMAYAYAIRAGPRSCERCEVLSTQIAQLDAASVTAVALARPSAAALQEVHTLQTLDAIQAGASMRQAAEAVYGVNAVASEWYADSGLRSRLRRLVRRGQALMTGGYRRLVQLE
ncbi:DNA -binding domain-containing protein [Pseudomonas aeruginosa]